MAFAGRWRGQTPPLVRRPVSPVAWCSPRPESPVRCMQATRRPGGRTPDAGYVMLKRLISLWVWLSVSLVALFWVPWLAFLYVLTAARDPGRYTVGRWFRRAAVVCTSLNPLWRFRTTGVRIRDPRRPYVAVANHESFADIFLLSHLPWEMKFLSKESIFKIPVMGWMMRMAGDIA